MARCYGVPDVSQILAQSQCPSFPMKPLRGHKSPTGENTNENTGENTDGHYNYHASKMCF